TLSPSNGQPGLVVRMNGFSIGTATLTFSPTPGGPPLGFAGLLEFNDLRIGVKDFDVTFGADPLPAFSGSIFVASGGARLKPGKPFSATITDRLTADDKNPDGSNNTEAIRLELVFDAGHVSAFQFKVDTMEIALGGYVTITARDFFLNTGATDTQPLVSFGS